ncbi:MAG: hypothetical protein DLM62_18570 [Pseudonocardiales bacterium]|nr:MAG: hypothetical protein DLM62_18570 [Pseudonocardiales bacterium]
MSAKGFGALPHAGHNGTGAYAHALAISCVFNVAATVLATVLVFALPHARSTQAPGDPDTHAGRP